MDKFTTHTGVGVPLRRSNVDTDQIIPAVYLKRVTRTGFEDGLFSAWRKDPSFVLNTEAYRDGSVLVATGPLERRRLLARAAPWPLGRRAAVVPGVSLHPHHAADARRQRRAVCLLSRPARHAHWRRGPGS